MSQSIECGGIVLCGGSSRRMGRDKATLPFGDETMLARVVRLLSEVVHPVVVVAAPGQSLPMLPTEIEIIRDERPSLGPLEGLRMGLTAVADRCEAAYATGCDVPLLSTPFVRRIIELLGEHDIAVPVEGQLYHPLAAVYRVTTSGEIERLLAEDKRRPVFLYEILKTHHVPVEELLSVDAELHTLRNLNHPDDYFLALEIAGLAVSDEIVAEFATRQNPRRES